MAHIGKYVFGCALLASGFVVANAQASTVADQFRASGERIVAHGSHSDCQDDGKGSHWHKGVKGKRRSCPGGKK